MSFEVIRPGFLSLIQDYGRRGHQHQGMGEGGPMDEHAFLWANHLLGNRFDAPALEITLGQLKLTATAQTCIALTGADTHARIDGRPINSWCTHIIRRGEELSLGTARSGLRSYLAVAGGFEIKPHYGSSATVMREGLGGLRQDGAQLAVGDILPSTQNSTQPLRCVPPEYIPDYAAPLTLRLIPGYQSSRFPSEAWEALYGEEYEVSQHADRMGYRLNGPALDCEIDGIISEGIAYGAVQVPADGQPIILLRDRQTIGGYPKLGCIASLDAAQLAQRPPGTRLRFKESSLQEVCRERLAFDRFLKRPPA